MKLAEIQQRLMGLTGIEVVRGSGIDHNYLNIASAMEIKDRYGWNFRLKNHNNFSLEIQYPNLGMSFCYNEKDRRQLIYAMFVTGEVEARTEKGLVFNNNLTLREVIFHYGVGDPRGTEDSDEGYVVYPGIIFYAKKKELTQLQADKIIITKIAVVKINYIF